MQTRRSSESAPHTETHLESVDTLSESALAYRQVATEYLAHHAPRVGEYLDALHESDLKHEAVLDQQPDYAIYIPIAANEAEENIRSTLDAIIERPFQKPEVFLYGNYTKDTSPDDLTLLNDRLDRIMEDYRESPAFSALRSVAVPVHYDQEFSMVQLRKEATDMIAADALERGLGFNYPVVSLDADVLKLSRTTLESLVTPIKNEGVTLTYGDSNLGYRDLPDTISSRLAVASEVLLRMEIRHSDDDFPYPEESCTAFSLGAYCMAEGYPYLQEEYELPSPINETPKLIRQMKDLLTQDTYESVVAQTIDGPIATNVSPQRVDHATVTRNGRRTLEYFAKQLAAAESQPEEFADKTRLLQEIMRARPTLDRHVATGGAYNQGFDSEESLRENNGIPTALTAVSRHALDLVMNDYFGPKRLSGLSPDTPLSQDPKLRVQQRVLRRYFSDELLARTDHF